MLNVVQKYDRRIQFAISRKPYLFRILRRQVANLADATRLQATYLRTYPRNARLVASSTAASSTHRNDVLQFMTRGMHGQLSRLAKAPTVNSHDSL